MLSPLRRQWTSGSNGPVPQTATAKTASPDLFCQYSPTPSGSSNGTMPGTGIVWAIEHQNSANPLNGLCNGSSQQAALHAFKATPTSGTLANLYSSRNLSTSIGGFTTFPTPTVFKGQVYMGTRTEVDVFGLCATAGPSGCIQ